ncbi:hypothetical protein BDR03DRAFT_1077160 [Suillus americanus]|nr:hypothetical protein BDR03DRAFT_1077160 [Suillus americanus]
MVLAARSEDGDSEGIVITMVGVGERSVYFILLFLSLGGDMSPKTGSNLLVLAMNLNSGFKHSTSLRTFFTWCTFVPSSSLRMLRCLV